MMLASIKDQFLPVKGMIAVQFKDRVWCYTREHMNEITETLTYDFDPIQSANLKSGIFVRTVIDKDEYGKLIKKISARFASELEARNARFVPLYEFNGSQSVKYIDAFLDGYYYSFHTISWSSGYTIDGDVIIHVGVRKIPNLLQKYVKKIQGELIFEINFMRDDVRSVAGCSFEFQMNMTNGRVFKFEDGGIVRELF